MCKIPSWQGMRDVREVDPLLYLNKAVIAEESMFTIPLLFENTLIPFDEASFHNTAINVMFSPFWHENFGHTIADDMLPVCSLMKIFHMVSRDAQIIIPHVDCCSDRHDVGSSE